MNARETILMLQNTPCTHDCTESHICNRCKKIRVLKAEKSEPWRRQFNWRYHSNAVAVDEEEKDRWTDDLINGWDTKKSDYDFVMSGDSVVLVTEDGEDSVEVFDCIIRRSARISLKRNT